MARLGSVLGGILAELAHARVVADQLSRDLVADYEADPVLATLAVPRVTLSEAQLTLRFTVDDVEQAPVELPDARTLRERWTEHAARTVLPRALDRLGVASADREAAAKSLAATVAPLSLRDVGRAAQGDAAPAARATSASLLDGWGSLPSAVRRRIGTKGTVRRELEAAAADELTAFIGQQRQVAEIRAALGSRLQVSIARDALPAEPSRLQEITLTVRSADLDTIIATGGEGAT